MNKFWDRFKHEEIVVHCKTKEEADEFLQYADDNGYRWAHGGSCRIQDNWDFYKDETCYCCSEEYEFGIRYCSTSYFREEGLAVLEWENLSERLKNHKDIELLMKSDLKTGMIVTLRNGTEHVVMLGVSTTYQPEPTDMIVHVALGDTPNPDFRFCWDELSSYDEFFKHKNVETSNYDIVKVEQAAHPYDCLCFSWDKDNRVTLWEETPEKMIDNGVNLSIEEDEISLE